MSRISPSTAAAGRCTVFIIGGPGSGKTQLSRRIGAALGLPVFELDLIAGDGKAPDFLPSNPLVERIARAEEIAASREWVTEGAFLWWTDPLLSRANTIIWLDPPRRRAVTKVTTRYFQDLWRGEAGLPAALRHPHLRWFVSFLVWSWRYYDPQRAVVLPLGSFPDELSRAAIPYALRSHEARVIHWRGKPHQLDPLSIVQRKGASVLATHH